MAPELAIEILEASEQECWLKGWDKGAAIDYVKSCDLKLAIERYQDLVDYFGDKDIAKTILEDTEEFKKWLERIKWHVRKVDELARKLEQEPNVWSVDDAREDFMHDVYNTLDFLPTNNEANRIIDVFDRVTSGLKQEPCEDAVSREQVVKFAEFVQRMKDEYNDNKEVLNYGLLCDIVIRAWKIAKLPSATPTHGTCKECANFDNEGFCKVDGHCHRCNFYCADYERGTE